jgi:ribosomal-protein-alanine N-acetyltransferase
MFIAETQRLLMREMTTDDAEYAYLLNLDPEVIQYTGDKSFESIDDARNFLTNYDHYKKYGYGRWALILKETNEYIGWCGLKYLPEANKNDVGFRLMKKYWNKGYATEAAIKSLELGFHRFNMESIVAHADIENHASIRVLEKIGMTFEKHYYEEERKCAAYKIDR